MSEKYQSRQQRNRKKKRKKKNKLNWIKKLFVIVFFLVLTGMIVGGVTVYSYIDKAPKLDVSLLKDPLSSKVYDMNGHLIADLGVEKRTKVSFQEIPDVVKDAFIAVEDVRFYDHFGIDIKRIGGALIANITEGFGAEGGSTITQQVVKNSFLSPEKSIKRKVQEAWLAVQLEQKYSKEQILEMYLNKIYFAKGPIYGVAKAAEVFFGKDITKDPINIEEAALLAALPKNPSYYNPFQNPENAEERRNLIISLMEKYGFITASEAKKAKSVPIEKTLVKNQKDTSPYEAFIDQVIEEVQQKLGDVDIFTAGLKIYTTLDPQAQTFVENVLETDQYVQYPNDQFQAGIVLLDTKTGEIRAIGGGRKQKVARGFNYATDSKRQPGSTIKPIIDYGPAIEYLQWSTYHQIIDEEHTYSNGQSIRNWDNEYWGQMSIRTALKWSRNIPALKTLQTVGLDRAHDFANKLGLDLNNKIYESYAIGGFTGVSPMELAGAYSAFGNKGVFNQPHTVRKVVFPDGRSVEMSPEPTIAMEEYTAFMITDMLKSVVQSGTGTRANILGLPLAGKTGTTNFDLETKRRFNIKPGGVPDIWFVGYTSKYTMSVWTGYSKTTSEHYLYGSQKQIAKKLFKTIMSNVHEDKKVTDFVKPNNVVKVGVEKGTMPAKLPSEFTPEDEIVYEYFVKGTEPTEISERYNQVDTPEDVMVEYEKQLDRILIRWNYDQAKKDAVHFEIQQAIGDQDDEKLILTDKLYHIIHAPKKGRHYKFKITTISKLNKENRSETVKFDIKVPNNEDAFDLIPDFDESDTHKDHPEDKKRDDQQKNPLQELEGNLEEGISRIIEQ